MKTFVAIYGAPVGAYDEIMKNASPEEKQKGMDAWNAWMEENKARFAGGLNAPLGKNKRVTKNGIEDKRNEVTGITVVQAESHEEAAKIFQSNPELKHDWAWVDVIEVVEMPTS